MKLYFASGNAHKAREFQALADAGVLRGAVEIASARELGGMPEVIEDAGTFTGNARKKALALRERLNLKTAIDGSGGTGDPPVMNDSATSDSAVAQAGPRAGSPCHENAWVFADDSGLCVDALGGAPGVESAYYAGPQGDHAANLAKLADAMRGMPDEKRGAYFVCVLVLLGPDGEEHVFEGRCAGRLAREPRAGAGGFGYDPLFVPDGRDETFSEIGDDIKNKLGHRGRAWALMENFLNENRHNFRTTTP